MLSLLLAVAEPSKVPFYLAGGLFGVWAVAVSWVGITRPSFPGDVGGQRLVILVSLVLAAAAIGTAIGTSR